MLPQVVSMFKMFSAQVTCQCHQLLEGVAVGQHLVHLVLLQVAHQLDSAANSYSNNLSAVLDYHRAVLQLVEAGSITWSRSYRATLDGLRVNFLAGLRVQPPNPSSSQSQKSGDSREAENKRRTEAEKETCRDYQDGKCDKKGDHDGKKHYCKYCWFKRLDKAIHQAVDCPFGKKKP